MIGNACWRPTTLLENSGDPGMAHVHSMHHACATGQNGHVGCELQALGIVVKSALKACLGAGVRDVQVWHLA